MFRLLTDLYESLVFLTDLGRTVLTEAVRGARAGPAGGPDHGRSWPG